MKVRYEFDLPKDTCVDCPLLVCEGEFDYYYCCPTRHILSSYEELYVNKRPDWCPLKVIEKSEEK